MAHDVAYEKSADKAMKVLKQSLGPKARIKKWGQAYRVPAVKRVFFGSGVDERASTASVLKFAVRHFKNFSSTLRAVKELSQGRTRTDALIWPVDNNRNYAGHPGALRQNPATLSHIATGHTTKDRNRGRAFETETRHSEAQGEIIHSQAVQGQTRANIETVRHFSIPFEQFSQQGPPTQTTFHAVFGDVSNTTNFNNLATHVHNTREELKWETASRLVNTGDRNHVPDVISEYLQNHNNDPVAARNDFNTRVNNSTETRINSATSSQALDTNVTTSLRNIAPVGNGAGRKRALSDARRPQ